MVVIVRRGKICLRQGDDNDDEEVGVGVGVDRVTCRQSRRCTEGAAMIYFFLFPLVGVYLSAGVVLGVSG